MLILYLLKNKLIRFYLFISIVLISVSTTKAQNDTLIQLAGIIVEAENDSMPLPYAHVINANTNRGTISDAEGIFTITGYVGDTIEFSSIGFQDNTYVIQSEQIIKVEMVIDIHTLPDQIIKPMPKNLSSLRLAIKNLEIKTSTDTLLANMEKAGFKKPPAYPSPPKPSIANPISLFYDKVIKKVQEKKKKKGVMPKLE